MRAKPTGKFQVFWSAHVAVVTTDEALGVYGAVDCGAYVANFLLAAEACGVAAVPQASLAFYSDLVREHFGLGSGASSAASRSGSRTRLILPIASARTVPSSRKSSHSSEIESFGRCRCPIFFS